jgi:hypothetical protein
MCLPNISLFFGEHVSYPDKATNEPLSEWPMELLDNKDSPASNDVYGKMFFYLRGLLVEFQSRIQSMKTFGVRLFPFFIGDIPRMPSSEASLFDRMEVSCSLSLH